LINQTAPEIQNLSAVLNSAAMTVLTNLQCFSHSLSYRYPMRAWYEPLESRLD